MKAMILAAGKGERLLPLTQHIPKPVFPIINVPVIRYNIEFLKKYGVTDLIINLFHLPKSIEQELGDGQNFGVKIQYSFEEELWGTGGGLKKVEKWLADEEVFLLLNSDAILDCDLDDAIHFHRRQDAAATMVVTEEASTKIFGAVELDDALSVRNIAGRIDDVRETPRRPVVFTGLHILTPKIFEYIPPNITSCINHYAYPKLLNNGERLKGYISHGFWGDMGRPESYYSLNMMYLDRKINLSYFDPLADFSLKPSKNKADLACLGNNVELGAEVQFYPPFVVGHDVKIGDGCRIGPYAIIGNGCQIGRQCQVNDSILFNQTKISAGSKIAGLIVTRFSKLRVPPSASNTVIIEPDPNSEPQR